MIVSNEGSPFIFHMRLIQLLSFPLKHTLVTYGCHKSPKLTNSIYRPRCATPVLLLLVLLGLLEARMSVAAGSNEDNLPLLVLHLTVLALHVKRAVNQMVEVVEAEVEQRVLEVVVTPGL